MTRMADRAIFDRVLFDPTPADLDAALKSALKDANDGNESKAKHLKWPPKDLAAFKQQLTTTPDGIHGWHGGSKPKYFAGKSQIIVAWWTNMLGTKHVRVLGGHGLELCERLHVGDNGQRAGLLSYAEIIYADHVGRAQTSDGEPTLVGLCACGAIGSFAALGWVGPCCGPCHDHRLEGNPPAKPRGHATDIENGPYLTFDPNDGSLLYSHVSGGLWRYRPGTGVAEPVPTPAHVGFPCRLTFLPDGRHAMLEAVRGDRNEVYTFAVWELGSPTANEWAITPGAMPTLRLSPDGEIIAVAHSTLSDEPRMFRLRSTRDGQVLRTLDARGVKDMLFSPDGKTLFVTDYFGGPSLWDLATGKLLGELPTMELNSPVFASDGRTVYGFHSDAPEGGASFELDGLIVRRLKSLHNTLNFSTISPDGRVLVAGGRSALAFWELNDSVPGERCTLSTDLPAFMKFAWSPDGRWLATSDREGFIRVWPWPAVYEAAQV